MSIFSTVYVRQTVYLWVQFGLALKRKVYLSPHLHRVLQCEQMPSLFLHTQWELSGVAVGADSRAFPLLLPSGATVSKEPRGQPGVRWAVLSSQPPLWERSPDAAVPAPSLTGTPNHQGFSIGTPSESAIGMTQSSWFAKSKEQKLGCQLPL